MAINPISFPQYNVNSAVDASQWQTLGNLGKVYEGARTDADKKRLLSQLGPDAAQNANLLVSSGHPELAQLGLTLQNRLQDQQRESDRFAITDARANTQQGIALAQEKRAQETYDEETPAGRAKKVVAAGVDPKSPQGKEYILTGKLPPPRDPTFNEAVDLRKQQAANLGLTEDMPAYKPFVLTGKMPREDAQPMTATDKKILTEADDKIIMGKSVLESLDRAMTLSPKAYTGPYADKRGYAASFLGRDSDIGKAGIATEALNNEVLSNALAQLKATFGAAPTEGERKILLELQGSVSKSHEARMDIYKRARRFAEIRLEAEQKRADELRGGTFYKPGHGASTPGATTPKAVPTFKIEPD